MSDERNMWQSSLSDDEIQKIEPESLQFVINQVEKYILSVKEACMGVQNKAMTLLTVSFPVFFAVSVGLYYFLKANETIEFVSALSFICCILFGLFFCLRIVMPKNTKGIGNIPENLLTKDLVCDEYEKGGVKMSSKYKELLFVECEQYKTVHDHMRKIMELSANNLKKAIISIIISPIVAFIVYLILECFFGQ